AVTAHHGMALSENGQRDAARPKIDRSLAQNPHNPWATHARAHLCYEEGDANAARAFLVSWLTIYRAKVASGTRRPRGRRCGCGIPAVPASLLPRCAQRAAGRESERRFFLSVALGTRRPPTRR